MQLPCSSWLSPSAFQPHSRRKGPTIKIIIKGNDLPSPIEITDPKVLQDFNIWTGPGTSTNEKEGLIVRWSAGTVTERPAGLPRYEVSFYAKHHQDGLDYVVYYEFDRSTGQGYVYIPGKDDDWWERNTFSIYRSMYGPIEGHWFHTRRIWEDLANPLITRLEVAGPLSR